MGIVLNKDQQTVVNEAIDWFRHDKFGQVFQIAGAAGTGKTVTIMAIVEMLGLRYNQICPCAYTGAAALVMKRRGFINACTIHSAMYEMVSYPSGIIDPKTSQPVIKKKFVKKLALSPEIQLIIIDEGYMVPEDMAEDIRSFGIKILTVGDPNQLDPVNGKPGFIIETKQNGKLHMLRELMRQSEDDAIVYLSQRAINRQIIHCGSYGNVLVIPDTELRPEMLLFSDCVLCGKNKTREAMNSYIRQLCGFNSPFPLYNEKVICRKNNWDLYNRDVNLVNGLVGRVLNSPMFLDPRNTKLFNIDFLPDNTNIPFQNLCLNYEYFSSGFEHKKWMRDFKEQDERTWKFPGEFFEFAYALSVHLSQGSEFNCGVYLEERMYPQMQHKLNYTAITRFKKSLIYVIKLPAKQFFMPNKIKGD